MNRSLALGLVALLILGTGCAGVQSASVEEQVSDVIEAWKAAWKSSDVEANQRVYSKNFEGDFHPEILEGEGFAEFITESDIVTEEATTTINGDTATVGPIYIEHVEIGLLIHHTLTKESDGWKITSTKGEEME